MKTLPQAAFIALPLTLVATLPVRAASLTWQNPQIVGARYDVRLFSKRVSQANEPMEGFSSGVDKKTGKPSNRSWRFVEKHEETRIDNIKFALDVLQREGSGRCIAEGGQWNSLPSDLEGLGNEYHRKSEW